LQLAVTQVNMFGAINVGGDSINGRNGQTVHADGDRIIYLNLGY
jgi:hypothetical protein